MGVSSLKAVFHQPKGIVIWKMCNFIVPAFLALRQAASPCFFLKSGNWAHHAHYPIISINTAVVLS